MRLIDADELVANLKRQYTQAFGYAKNKVVLSDFYIARSPEYRAALEEQCINDFIAYLDARPTVDAVPREEYEKVKADRDSWEEAWRESENEIND